jgi:PKHD-type hydroxylase
MAIIKPFRFLPSIKRKDYNPDFADYTWFNNFFSEEEVEKIRSLWSEDLAKNAAVNNAGKEEMRDELRKSQIMFIKPGINDWIYDRLSQACIQTNTNRYKFDITGFQTELQLANYSNTDFFDWHMDFGAGDISNRKLSITVQLSDSNEYEGGDLQFMINQNIVNAPREKGTAIIFPSFALHRVTPVTKGSRKSIVGWIAGPPYK